MNSKISVIIPVYNVKEYLREAIDSIINQKGFLHEIIIIDDGSTDGSHDLLEKLYGNLDFIKIIHKENQGQGIARNLGTELSSGNFIYYFDSDDISIHGLFEKFCQVLSEKPDLELFCFSGEIFLDKNYSSENIDNRNILSKEIYKRKIEAVCSTGEEAYILLNSKKGYFPGPPLYIFKKSILGTNDIKFRAIRYEDEEFTIKLFLNSGQTIIDNDVYFKRRVRRGSTMQLSRSFKDILGYIKNIETLVQLKEHQNLKQETKSFLNRKIFGSVRAIIELKVRNKLKLSKEEKKIYKNSLKPYILGSRELFFFYYKYPVEYKLRQLKSKIFN